MSDMVTWAIDIENTIFSLVKAKINSTLLSKYPDTFFTIDDDVISDPVFPTIYFHFYPSKERGQDLIGETINGILMTVDVKVIVNSKIGMQGAKEIQKEVIKAFKSLRFEVKLPEFEENVTDLKISTARFSRVIGQGTTF